MSNYTADETTTSTWHSYSKIYALGHRALRTLMDGPVLIEEKVDGSQFSFGVFDGEIRVRSRNRVFDIYEANSMFLPVCATVQRLSNAGLLHDGWTYRGETLQRPKHNTLTYGRVPVGNIVIWDIENSFCGFLSREEKEEECKRLGLECTPVLFQGTIESQEQLNDIMGLESFLGGCKIEGFVIKAYDKFDVANGGKVLMGKWVSAHFKEVHSRTFKSEKKQAVDLVDQVISAYATEARWQKAVQHLAEDDKLVNAPQDIPTLLTEIQADVKQECEEEIKQLLFNLAWKKIQRGITRGAAEWYKRKLQE